MLFFPIVEDEAPPALVEHTDGGGTGVGGTSLEGIVADGLTREVEGSVRDELPLTAAVPENLSYTLALTRQSGSLFCLGRTQPLFTAKRTLFLCLYSIFKFCCLLTIASFTICSKQHLVSMMI